MGGGETRAPAGGQWAGGSMPWGCRDWGRGMGRMGGADTEGPEQGWKARRPLLSHAHSHRHRHTPSALLSPPPATPAPCSRFEVSLGFDVN